ncbi:energy transducer TonB [Cyclobacterium marinum]|uniref:TonB family protein n=1 Tax=Cyclobacterium marinum (strain ATCC 25205 / DSM 745 / LMG 13164 / NCIMB 1802) TaxID=880070 RepID=G0IUS9_CYCMS|nr:energy transducer TonB [Cyclobacterium marinum]AEL25471.1 TonB family protein [Cyclobacterium marinum DSM 745]
MNKTNSWIKLLITITFCCSALYSSFSQALQKVNEKSKNPNMVSTYHVLKDSQIKEGVAEMKYKGKLGFRVKGQFSQGNKSGIWEFFDSDNTIIQKYNYTTKKFEYLQNFNSLQAVFILKDQDLVKLETGAIPVLLGGDAKFLYFLANNIHYPHAARTKGATGTVGVMVTITKEGEMVRPFIPKPGDKALDAEALRVVSMMPNDWIPLYLNGEPTDCLVLLYVNFQLG